MPSIPSEFEEREFEVPLYNQLGSGTHLVWSPGQVFEEHIGIDYALMLLDSDLWPFFGATNPLSGVFLHRYKFNYIWRERRKRRNLPNFRLNLFLQAKRSHYYKRRPRHLIQYLNRGACWRFNVEQHQQEALERLSDQLGSRAMVCYAAPAFHRVNQLNAHTSRKSIIQSSVFPNIAELHDHTAFYYQAGIGNGIANANPEVIKLQTFDEMLERLTKSSPDTVRNEPRAELKNLGEEIYKMVMGRVSDDNPRKAIYVQLLEREVNLAEGIEGPTEAMVAFARVASFCIAFNCEWLVVSHS